jgi:threonine dehydratase
MTSKMLTETIDSIDRDRIAETARRIAPHVRRTPVIEVRGEDFGLGPLEMAMKLELMQHAGSFKARGAFANMLLRDVPPAGVVAASGGNHGAAVAYAAMQMKVPAKIFVPSISSAPKIARIRRYGADLVVGGERYADALAASERWGEANGAMVIHAFDQKETLLGQGSVGMELEAQVPDLDTVLVAVGGGGLIGGIAAWFRGKVRIVGVEPAGAPTLTRALEAGRPVDAETGSIAADSLAPRRVGELMFPLAQRYVDHVVLVSDDDIAEAQRALWTTLAVVAEPGGAAAAAALFSKRYRPRPGEKLAVVISGGNSAAVAFGGSMAIEHIKPGARFSQAAVHGDTIYIAGQVPDDLGADIETQTRQVLAKIDALLAEAGSDRAHLVSANIWLSDISGYAAMNAVWDAWIAGTQPPARACVESKIALPGCKIEIAAIAARR